MRSLLIVAALTLAACAPTPSVPVAKADPAKEAWYGETVTRLTAMTRQAETLFQQGRRDEAATLITDGQPLIHRVLSIPEPTLPAMEAVSDLDQLYGQMLLTNRQYVWAQTLFRKNVTRWSHWKPQTPDTLRRLQLARDGISQCVIRNVPNSR